MGGGYHVGNWSAVAEFNIIIDPEAAHIVFNEKWPVVMVGLDLTHQALATPEVVAQIEAVGTKPAKFVMELMEFFTKTYKDAQGFDYPPVHDPCAVVVWAHVVEDVRPAVPVGGRFGLPWSKTHAARDGISRVRRSRPRFSSGREPQRAGCRQPSARARHPAGRRARRADPTARATQATPSSCIRAIGNEPGTAIRLTR